MQPYCAAAIGLLVVLLLNACLMPSEPPDAVRRVRISFAAPHHERRVYEPVIATFTTANPDGWLSS
jgi:hypothetical protein